MATGDVYVHQRVERGAVRRLAALLVQRLDHFPEQLGGAHRHAVAPGCLRGGGPHVLSELPDLLVPAAGWLHALDVLQARVPEAHLHLAVFRRDSQLLLPELDAEILEELTHRRLRSEEHTSELQSHSDLVCRLLLEKKKNR